MNNNIGIIILAAGLGTRMKSDKAKVLHEVNGKPMLHFVMETASEIAGSNVTVVVGHQADRVKNAVSTEFDARFALQQEQLGTGHAVLCALPHIDEHVENVVILCGDVPLITSQTLNTLVNTHLAEENEISVLSVLSDNPKGYGRIIEDGNGNLVGIVEEADADPDQKKIKCVNSGVYCVRTHILRRILPKIQADNAQQELYLTDVVKIGYEEKRKMGAILGKSTEELLGINSREDLKQVENIMKRRISEIS